jgi:hypothetical protein
MEIKVDLEIDFIELLTQLISEKDNQNPEERNVRDLKCSQPVLGRWIDGCDFPFLMDTLALADGVFSQEFPGIELTQNERKEFARSLEDHCQECARCHAKQAEDIAWKLQIETAFAENKRAIGKALGQAAGKP